MCVLIGMSNKTLLQWIAFLGIVMAVSGTSTSPIVCVLSGSMEPTMQRGDLVITNRPVFATPHYKINDIVVFQLEPKINFPQQNVPIIHRIVGIDANGTILD
jgi:signal peptidase I